MAESTKPPVGDTLALLLDSTDCPPSIRTAIINHLSELYEQSNLMHPQIVRTLYPMLLKQNGGAKQPEAAAPKAAAPVPFPLSVAQPQQAPTQPIAVPASASFPSAPQAPAANPFANRPAPTPPSAAS
ncbi:MAG: hypothetical protein HOP19_17340 [Acidobacteria bacterium]|nr:hypothetical protein [Acidobacteriota bacterium]